MAISEWLTEHLAGITRSNRMQQQKKELTPAQLLLFDQYLDRLLQHEPIQYVLQEAWFCGLHFYVDHNVLIPRPETEELVEWVISHCRFPLDDMSIADIGTGSGCIPVAIKKRLAKATVTGYDISPGALNVARKNAATLGIDVSFHELDFLDPSQRTTLPFFDIIISNPPYIPIADKEQLAINVTAFEPSAALFVPDNDPLTFYHALADFGLTHLHPGGSIYMEIHHPFASKVMALFAGKGYTAEVKKDMQGKERMVRGVREAIKD